MTPASMEWLKNILKAVAKIALSARRPCTHACECVRIKVFGSGPFLPLWLVGTLGLLVGCSLLGTAKKEPTQPSAEQRLIDEQLQLQRFADDFFARENQGLDQSAEQLGTDEGRQQVLQIKLLLNSSVLGIVSGPNPNVNLLDLVSVTVLTRLSVQEYWMHTTNGAAFEPWLHTSRVLETNVWDLAARFLQPAQMDELRAGINNWYAKTPDVRTMFFARPHAFVESVRTTQQKEASSSNAFSLVNLDPTGELSSAVREVTQSRLLAERAMYTAQRMPFLLRLQGEQFTYEVTAQPTFRMALSNSMRASESIASVSQTVRQIPDRIAAERKETLATFESQQGKLRDLAGDIDRTLVSGEKMSSSLSITLTNAKAFVETLRAGATNTNTPPITILDYAKAADQISLMAQNLNTLIASINQSEPEIQRLRRQASADLESAMNHGFRLELALIAVLLIGAVLAGLAYRFLAGKLTRRPTAE